ncbi:PREDICTED: F-box/kelch-repeat protein At2g43270-like [Camelina sativa]|uniref:F-box/kelch-repeat protein At2g43270-like n=1 Tax=Camelina sativa TaxID=90675 RepID=A0ABM0ZL49_CAMSA|nr:PREDICTED: F-box/kelch-repeat protein At2g43270-like [Camelina sativa]
MVDVDLVVPADLVEEILVRLPVKSILKFKSVSRQWRSIVESTSFARRRRRIIMNTTKPQILAAATAGNHATLRRRFKEEEEEEEEEVDMFYLHCDAAATLPSLTCDGLVCIPVPGSINVLNPSTGELLSFPSGPDPVKTDRYDRTIFDDSWWDIFPGYWAMGFGRDEVNGSYKVVRMFFDTKQSEILDINIGEWRKLPSPPPYYVEARRKSASVNGSIYWLHYDLGCTYWIRNNPDYKILALDLHTEEFRDVPPPPTLAEPGQLVNLQDRLAIAIANAPPYYWELTI